MAVLLEVLIDVRVEFAVSGNVTPCTWLQTSWRDSNSPSSILNNVL